MERADDTVNASADLISELRAEVGGDAAFGEILASIRDLGAGPAPTPSPELAMLLASGLQVNAAHSAHARRRLPRFALGAAIVIVLGATGGAAFANDSIRLAAETAIANAVNAITPFHVEAPKPVQAPGEQLPASTTPSPAPSNNAPGASPSPGATTNATVPQLAPTTAVPGPVSSVVAPGAAVPGVVPSVVPSGVPAIIQKRSIVPGPLLPTPQIWQILPSLEG
jgi:hypothetical protein